MIRFGILRRNRQQAMRTHVCNATWLDCPSRACCTQLTPGHRLHTRVNCLQKTPERPSSQNADNQRTDYRRDATRKIRRLCMTLYPPPPHSTHIVFPGSNAFWDLPRIPLFLCVIGKAILHENGAISHTFC